MCVVSMVMDHQIDKWGPYTVPYPGDIKWPYQEFPGPPLKPLAPKPLTPEEIQKQLDDFKKLIERAREYDKKNNEPDCGLDEKRKVLKDMAKQLGVEITFL